MRFLLFVYIMLCIFVMSKLANGGGLLTINFYSLTQIDGGLSDYCDGSQYLCDIKAIFCIRFGKSAEHFDCSYNDIISTITAFVYNDGYSYELTENNSFAVYTDNNFNGQFEIYSEILIYNSSSDESFIYDGGYFRTSTGIPYTPKVGVIQGYQQYDAVIVNLDYVLECSPSYAGAHCISTCPNPECSQTSNTNGNNSSQSNSNNSGNDNSQSNNNNEMPLAITAPQNLSTIPINLSATSYRIIKCMTQGNPTDVYWLDEHLNYVSYDDILFLGLETIQHINGSKLYYCYAANGDELVYITISVIVENGQRDRMDILNDVREGLSVDEDFDSEAYDSFNDYLISLTSDLDSMSATSDEYEFSDEDYEVLDEVSSTYQVLVKQFTRRYNVIQQRNVTERLLNTANGILRLSTRSNNNQTNNKNQRSVAKATNMAYEALEYLSISIADNLDYLDTSGTYSIAYDSINIYGQSWTLSELRDKPNIRVPESRKGEQVEIPIELIKSFGINANKFSIATTVVNTYDYYSFQDTEPDTLQLASRTMQIVLPTNYSIVNGTVFPNPIKISFNVTSLENSMSKYTCVFLNSTSLAWSTKGVSSGNTTNETIDCYTTHLTNFAVLVTPQIVDDIEASHDLALTILSYILGLISFILLVLSLVLFLAASSEFFKKESNIVYFNCCLAMFFAMGLFIFGSRTLTFNLALCKAVAFLLHYTWLTVFAWMFCIGLLLLHSITLGTIQKYKIYPWLLIIGWVCPVIIPIITFGVGYNDYMEENPEYCFLQGDQFYAFFVPAYTVIVFNLIIFCFTLIKIFYAMKKTSNIKQSDIRKKTLIAGLTLTPILGLPWGFNVIGFFSQHPAISWIHVVLNGSFGISFFFIVVVLNDEVQALFCKARKIRKRTLKSKISTTSKSGFVMQRPRARATMKNGEDNGNSPTSGSICKVSEIGEIYANSSQMEKDQTILETLQASSITSSSDSQIESNVMIGTQ